LAVAAQRIDVIASAPADREVQQRNWIILGTLVVWFAYTRIYWGLQATHVALPPCPFYALTGHPCPFCGGTRSFAYMWQGDVVNAARLYPFGPLLFVGSLGAAVATAVSIVSRRTVVLNLPRRVELGALAIAVGALAVSWVLKLVWLGN
jgi:hypothetical protein